jgi:hypothetical protein
MTNAISEIITTANISPAALLEITAEALAASGCTCRELPAGSSPCRACREAAYLSKIANTVDLHAALVAVTEACGNAEVALVDLLPSIVEGFLARACTCVGTETCAICTAARKLDDLARGTQAS